MDQLLLACVESGLFALVLQAQEFHAVVHKGELGKVLILCCFFQHFQQPTLVLFVFLAFIAETHSYLVYLKMFQCLSQQSVHLLLHLLYLLSLYAVLNSQMPYRLL